MVTAATLVKGVIVVYTLTSCVVWGLWLGAFNAHVFGPTKARKEEVMTVLAKIAVRYDILLVQEVKDASGQAILKLLQKIKNDHGVTMNMSISDRLGRTHSKEQYAFLYRADRGISVVDSLHFDDGEEGGQDSSEDPVDLFQREPYIVRFQAANCKVRDFTLVALHAMPSQTVRELQALSQVVSHVQKVWKTSSILVLGDLNADCAYVPKKAWPQIELRHDRDFWWPIGDDVDTTVKASTDCAYDRFIIRGRELRDVVVPDSVQTFDFQTQYDLTEDQALDVSDHYPIELRLQDKVSQQRHKNTFSHASSGSQSLMDVLQQAWQAVVKRFSRRWTRFDL